MTAATRYDRAALALIDEDRVHPVARCLAAYGLIPGGSLLSLGARDTDLLAALDGLTGGGRVVAVESDPRRHRLAERCGVVVTSGPWYQTRWRRAFDAVLVQADGWAPDLDASLLHRAAQLVRPQGIVAVTATQVGGLRVDPASPATLRGLGAVRALRRVRGAPLLGLAGRMHAAFRRARLSLELIRPIEEPGHGTPRALDAVETLWRREAREILQEGLITPREALAFERSLDHLRHQGARAWAAISVVGVARVCA